jgi:transcriptional regulator with XRE-family HTH domain
MKHPPDFPTMNEAQDDEQPFYSALGRILRERRKAAGWTQSDLVCATGLSTTTIWYLETGKKQVSLATVMSVAKGFTIAPGVLLHQAIEEANCEVLAD